MRIHPRGILAWVGPCLGVAAYFLIKKNPIAEAEVKPPLPDESLLCNVGSACSSEFSASNWTEALLWPEVDDDTRKERIECERGRLGLNKNQPKLVPKFTVLGYEKMRTPEGIFGAILDWYKPILKKGESVRENWRRDNTYVNHWKVDTKMVHVPPKLKKRIFSEMQGLLESWAGVTLSPTALYGVRHYYRGSVLATHVDRVETHVISAIINVAQEVDRDWVLFVRGHDGLDNEIIMEPGDMVLYESASVIHGRPTALEGDMFANLFLHYAPSTGWDIKSSSIPRS
ncbi:unnamed protein product [Discosporangium mesarthrocarpum]